MTQQAALRRSRSDTTAAALLGFVTVLALPSALLAFANQVDLPGEVQLASNGGFVPAEVDPRLSRSITVRALSKGKLFRFTPAATPSLNNASVVTVAVRLGGSTLPTLAARGPAPSESSPNGSTLRIAPAAYSLGTARGYRSFAQNAGVSAPVRQGEMPDLASYQPKPGVARDPSRFAPRLSLDEQEKTGSSPRTFVQSDQQVDVGGSYRVTRNLNVTAGVRVTSDRDRLRPLTDGRQDSQAVYVGTQFRF